MFKHANIAKDPLYYRGEDLDAQDGTGTPGPLTQLASYVGTYLARASSLR
jgi:hypothetical protein